MRATFMPCSASGIAQPTITSFTSAGSSPGASAMTDLIAWASMSSGRTWPNMPFALGHRRRVAATM